MKVEHYKVNPSLCEIFMRIQYRKDVIASTRIIVPEMKSVELSFSLNYADRFDILRYTQTEAILCCEKKN